MSYTEYIERKKVLRIINHRTIIPLNYRELLQEYIKLEPAADVVEVVRCKDCAIPHNKFLGCPYLNGLIPPENHFCGYGKRKEASA